MPIMAHSPSADHFRRATRESDAAQTPAARIERALELGRLGLAIYASANGLSLPAARKALDERQLATPRRTRDPSAR